MSWDNVNVVKALEAENWNMNLSTATSKSKIFHKFYNDRTWREEFPITQLNEWKDFEEHTRTYRTSLRTNLFSCDTTIDKKNLPRNSEELLKLIDNDNSSVYWGIMDATFHADDFYLVFTCTQNKPKLYYFFKLSQNIGHPAMQLSVTKSLDDLVTTMDDTAKYLIESRTHTFTITLKKKKSSDDEMPPKKKKRSENDN